MANTTLAFGALLVLLGVGSWLGTGRSSVTALIPAFLGLALLLCGALALSEARRRLAMHVAAGLALVGAAGSLSRALPSLAAGDALRVATLSQLATAVLLLVFVGLCVRSFVDARRAAGD